MSLPKVLIKDTLLFLGLILLIMGGGYFLTTYLTNGWSSGTDAVSAQTEKFLGGLFRAALKNGTNGPIIEKPEVSHALKEISQRLEAGLQKPLDSPLEIFLLDNQEINAYALPGGMIVVTTSLFLRTDNPEELAAVLAHEMGHIVEKDSFQHLVRTLGLSVLLNMGGAGSAQIKDALGTLANNNFTRAQEARADHFALELLSACKLDPGHLGEFLKKMPRSSFEKILDNSLNPLADHPGTDERVAKSTQASLLFLGPEKPFTSIASWDKLKKLL